MESAVLLNGYTNKWFPIHHSVRQGDPISLHWTQMAGGLFGLVSDG